MGKVYLDKVTIGALSVPNQAVEAATTMSATFIRERGMDGLLGLGFSKLNTIKPTRQQTWFDNIRPKLAAPVFTASLKRKKTGSYDFGYIDKSKYKGEIVYTNVLNGRGHWGFQVTGYQIGNGSAKTTSFQAISDTGSSLWYMPKGMADEYWGTVPGAKNSGAQWNFPCAAKLPDMSVVIGGKKVTVPGENMNYQSIGTTCFGGIQRDLAMPFSIFGDVFMKGLFVIHESPPTGQARIGFARAA
jgi:aspergillopepsin I